MNFDLIIICILKIAFDEFQINSWVRELEEVTCSGNMMDTIEKKKALTEGLGRIAGWWGLIFNKPFKI